MGALVIADGEAAAVYSECQRRHAAVVAAYQAMRMVGEESDGM